jgi:hypothetical protein
MFRATMCPSSGETTVCTPHLVLVILYGWLSGIQGGIPPCIPDSCFSWWWAHCRPKHVEKRNKHTKNKLCINLALFTRLYKNVRSTKHKQLILSLNVRVCVTWWLKNCKWVNVRKTVSFTELLFIARYTNSKWIYRYINLLCYKQRSLIYFIF